MRVKWIFTALVLWILAIAITVIAYPEYIAGLSPAKLRIGIGIAAVVSLVLLRLIYINLLHPINAITNGMDLIRAQDFGSRLVKVGQTDADKLVGMFNKMIDTLKLERLKNIEQGHFLHLLINASPTGIAILDFDERFSMVNPAMLTLLDVKEEDAIGKKPGELLTEVARAINEVPHGKVVTVRLSDTKIVRISHLSFMETGFTRPFIIAEILTDEVMKAEKEAYGKVIRLIAHEVNNTMTGVNSILETVATIMEGESDIVEAVDSCRERCGSLNEFITSYADVVRIPPPTFAKIELRELMEKMLPFLEGLTGKDIHISIECTDRDVFVSADPVLLEQVMVNIVKNSKESILSTGCEGEILIRVDAAPASIEITDNGAGISGDTAKKLFSPFFSTKRGGQGLGLMMVGEILRKHGCRFSLRTNPDDGLTRFKIEFPKVQSLLHGMDYLPLH